MCKGMSGTMQYLLCATHTLAPLGALSVQLPTHLYFKVAGRAGIRTSRLRVRDNPSLIAEFVEVDLLLSPNPCHVLFYDRCVSRLSGSDNLFRVPNSVAVCLSSPIW